MADAAREIGATGLRVPPLCFGTSALGGMPGTYGYDVGEARALDTVRAILALPDGFLDTSPTTPPTTTLSAAHWPPPAHTACSMFRRPSASVALLSTGSKARAAATR